MDINKDIAASLHKTNVSEAVGRVIGRLVTDYMLASNERINELRNSVASTLGPVPLDLMQEIGRKNLEATFDTLIALNGDLSESILAQAIRPLEEEERRSLIALRDTLTS